MQKTELQIFSHKTQSKWSHATFFIQQKPPTPISRSKETYGRRPKSTRLQKIRRGYGKSNFKNEVVLVGNNCAGIKNKKESLLNMLTELKVGILFLQETKLYTKGQIRLANYVIFETNRPQNGGGGLLTAVHEKFQPSLLETENDNPDILIVQCKIANYNINLINGYGPQESETSWD